jgi:hypothetical protein
MSLLRICAAFVALGLLASCHTVHTDVDRTVKLTSYQHIYVERELSDGRHLDRMLAKELIRLGYDASSGPLTLMPEDTQAIIAYQAQWTFDFTTYLIELDLAVRDAKSGREVGVSRYFHPAVLAKDPAKIVAAAIDPIFARPAAP